MRVYIGLAALAVLSACGGTGGTGVTPAPNPNGPPVQGITLPGGIVGHTYTANAARTTYDPAVPLNKSPVSAVKESVKFLSDTVVELTMPGSTTPITLTLDPAQDKFVDASGQTKFWITNTLDGGLTYSHNLLYFFVDDFSGANVFYDTFVHGNRTQTAVMPTSGTATYAGVVQMFDGTGPASKTNGTFNLAANFGGQVSGTLAGILPADTSLSFDLVPVMINGNGFVTGLTSVGNATTVNANSLINGKFFGHDASEIGGTVVLDTSAGTASGVFGGAVP
jgi:hypothetical protein